MIFTKLGIRFRTTKFIADYCGSLCTALSFKIAGGNSKMLLFLAGLLVFLLSYFIILLL